MKRILLLALGAALGAATAESEPYPTAEKRVSSPGHTVYHIDPDKGDDTKSGLDHDHAWKTFRHINQLRLAPGDRVEIVAPGAFDQTLALAGGGTAEAPVEVRFAAGRYDFHPDNAFRDTYQISNTNSVPDGLKAVGMLLAGAKHVRVSGPDATIVYRGKMIEVCIDGSEDINLSGLAFDYHRPTVSEFKVVEHGEPVIHIDPSNNAPNSSVHRNIRIENNEFELRGTTAVQAKSTTGLRVAGNTIRADKNLDNSKIIQTSDCAEVVIENNK
ncbi:MAG: hypothetical protein WCS43_13160 [Verrucomicrobiota bacterium]